MAADTPFTVRSRAALVREFTLEEKIAQLTYSFSNREMFTPGIPRLNVQLLTTTQKVFMVFDICGRYIRDSIPL